MPKVGYDQDGQHRQMLLYDNYGFGTIKARKIGQESRYGYTTLKHMASK